jgi:hypothetical protein
MGALSATDMAEQVDIRTALSWHLTSNHYPPVPTSMIEPCIEAIDAYNDGDPYRDIDLPEGVFYRGQAHAPAYDIIEQHHLDFWIEYDD